jgi:hypothetical protein
MDASKIPDVFYDDDGLRGDLVVAVGECVALDMDETEWRKFAVRHGRLADMTVDRQRFLRSLSWGDSDHEGMVIELIQEIFPRRSGVAPSLDPKPRKDPFLELFGRPGVQRRFQDKHAELAAFWNSEPDHLVEAVALGVGELDAVSGVIDLTEHRARIQSALPGDPRLAIGSTKDMLEATMRTIMDARGKPQGKNVDFPVLVTACLTELGLTPNTPPADEAEKHVRAIASAAKTMLVVANEFRNSAGSGHGKVVGKEVAVTADDASLVASSGFILAAWMLKRHRATQAG